MLKDNIGKYEAEAVGYVKDTHRYRGLADFQFSATELPYLTEVADHLLPLKGTFRPALSHDLGVNTVSSLKAQGA